MKDGVNLRYKYLWSLSLKECISATFLGTLMGLSKLIDIPMHIPGHSGLIWVAILTFCCLTFRKAGAGTLAGMAAGFITSIFGIGNDGPFVFFKYFLPGLTMDIIFTLLPFMIKRWYLVSAAAALAHWTKLFCNYIIGIILEVPQGFLMLGLKAATVDHLIFGFMGGWLAYMIFSNKKYFKSLNLFGS